MGSSVTAIFGILTKKKALRMGSSVTAIFGDINKKTPLDGNLRDSVFRDINKKNPFGWDPQCLCLNKLI